MLPSCTVGRDSGGACVLNSPSLCASSESTFQHLSIHFFLSVCNFCLPSEMVRSDFVYEG
jgi:hypothetical protein